MSQTAFRCPLDDMKYTFDYCIQICEAKCYRGNVPLLLFAMPDERPVIKDQWSVTQITSPPQVTLLRQRYDYADYPNRGIKREWGTMMHKGLAEQEEKLKNYGLENDFIIEKRFDVVIETSLGIINLRGTPDIRILKQKALWDYKGTTAYSIGKAFKTNKEWFWQTNIYRHYAFPDAEELVICGFVRDHTKRLEENEGIQEVTMKDVPIYPDKDVVDYVIERLVYLKTCQDNDLYPRYCTDEERWGGVRCEHYCAVNEFCEQYQKEVSNV